MVSESSFYDFWRVVFNTPPRHWDIILNAAFDRVNQTYTITVTFMESQNQLPIRRYILVWLACFHIFGMLLICGSQIKETYKRSFR